MMDKLYGLVMAGGSGTRLWPLSREYYPKQFLKLTGDKTLIQQTFLRIKSVVPTERIFITTNRVFVDEIVIQLGGYGLLKENIIVQPANKNTGPTLAWASKVIYDYDNEAIIVNCPSDHLISPRNKFISYLKSGFEIAQTGKLVTLGINPNSPNPEYGYITKNKSTFVNFGGHTCFKVTKFIEKPSVNKARSLIRKGSFWNSGIFIWKADAILDEIKKFDPKTFSSLGNRIKYISLPSSPIDTTVLEKSNNVWVIPAVLKWVDIGSWKAMYELASKDKDRNVLNTRAIAMNCKGSLIYGGENRLVSAINLRDIVIVDTQDSVLVSHKNDVHKIKDALAYANEKGLTKSNPTPLVSIITATNNDKNLIENSMLSVIGQSYKNIEHIIVDRASSDNTLKIVRRNIHKVEILLSNAKSTRFERINEGISYASGEIIGILDPENSFFDSDVIKKIVEEMEKNKSDVAWGDMVYFNRQDENKPAMYWRSSLYKDGMMQSGWSPPHPTFFVRKEIYEKFGLYKTKFNVAADYELMLRYLIKNQVKSLYIPRVLVKMVGKGLNLKNVVDRVSGNFESYQAWKENGLSVNPSVLLFKNISKITQLLEKRLDLTN